ncbi:MAG: hypothetical protein R3D67_19930 [Hyphomicrobiaceae bacterium]
METTQTIKLPVLATVRQSWSSVLANLGLIFRLIWPWITIMILCGLSIGAGILVNNGLDTPSPTLIGGASVVPVIAMVIAFLLAIPAVAVGWHRGIFRGERPQSPIRIDGGVWGYLGYSMLLGIMAGLFNLLMFAIAAALASITVGVGEGPMSLERLIALAPFLPLAFIPTLLILNRFLLVLPAVAVGRSLGFGEALKATRGNTLRLTFAASLVSLPIVIMQGVTQLAVLASQNPILVGVLALLNIAVLIYCSFASLSFLSLSMKQLTPEPEMMEAAA